jgi:RNA polymerase sigma factor (sigma-70 family)
MRSDGRADDLVQQTFLSAFTALRAGTEVKHLRGWLYRILRNEMIRTSSRRVVEVELDPTTIASESLEEASQRRMRAFDALSSIAALPARQRDVLVASALNGESRAAVAGSMGLSEGAVRQLMHRARATLRSAAAAITPAPLANWMAAVRDGPAGGQAPEIAIGAGTGSAAGVALKLGAIIASGAIATGVVGSQLHARAKHRPVVRVQPQRFTSSSHRSPALVSAEARIAHDTGLAGHPAGAAVAAQVIHPGIGSASPPRARGHARSHDDHRGSGRGESHESGSGGGGPGPSRASGGDGRAQTGDGGDTSGKGAGADNGGSAIDHRDGSNGEQSSGSAGGQSATQSEGGGGGSGGTLSSGDSGSGGGVGSQGRDSSRDVAPTGSESRGEGSSSSGDSNGASLPATDTAGSDESSGH